MRFTLRPYQQAGIDEITQKMHLNPILVAPTGSGKTVMGVALVERLGVRCLWLAHRTELIQQAATRLGAYGLSVGIIKAGFPAAPFCRCQVASVQTLIRRDLPPAQLVIVDECHHATATTYRKILEGYPQAPRVGLTATPFRLDGKGLGDLFG
ncbi:MAG: DEAD/DEAH box helicase family protein, partial [Planctomycetes bacterium]|nr:DEAD/DEAH box helicase family protein [Planctomycetota bacterium]